MNRRLSWGTLLDGDISTRLRLLIQIWLIKKAFSFVVISELRATCSVRFCFPVVVQGDTSFGKKLFSNRIMINNRWLIVWLDDAFASSAFDSRGHPLHLANLEWSAAVLADISRYLPLFGVPKPSSFAPSEQSGTKVAQTLALIFLLLARSFQVRPGAIWI